MTKISIIVMTITLALVFAVAPMVYAVEDREVVTEIEKAEEVIADAEVKDVIAPPPSSSKRVSEQYTIESVIRDYDSQDNPPMIKFYFTYRTNSITGEKTPAQLIITDGEGIAFFRFNIGRK
ncbi:MAG TPA: hypothetical protein ENI27_06370 [bacterium]|nr:hypothetical protein [bacterium]